MSVYTHNNKIKKDINGKNSKSYYVIKYIPFIDKNGNYIDYSINNGRIIYDESKVKLDV